MAGRTTKATKGPPRYFIVNPAGTVHEVTKDHAAWRLRQVGYRMAKAEEIAAYKAAKIQRFDQPIAEPWDPEPEPEPEPEPSED